MQFDFKSPYFIESAVEVAAISAIASAVGIAIAGAIAVASAIEMAVAAHFECVGLLIS